MLGRLVETGNTVVVIEHNLDVIKTADWVIDLGPGGRRRRRCALIVAGTPEEVARTPESYTGHYLRPALHRADARAPAARRRREAAAVAG